jgi:alkylation response protein AidB-like acyl-CoA dehydrogenase
MFLRSVKELAENEFAERAFTWEGSYPRKNVELLADRGFLGVNYDSEYGGGMSELEAVLMSEVVGRVCPDTAAHLTSIHFVGPRTLDMFGSDEVRRRYLEPVANGEGDIAAAISEPEAGSDVKSMSTTVEADEDGVLRLNGVKTWVSKVPQSAAAVVWVKYSDGLGSVVVDLEKPGVDVPQRFTNMAGETQVELRFDDVRIPAENVLTRGPEAFREQLKALNWERLGLASQTNAIAALALERALSYAQDRVQFDQPIGEFQGIEWKLADMVSRLEASRALMYGAVERATEQGRVPEPLHAAIASLYSVETVGFVVDEALQIHGANGYMRNHPLEYLYRLVRGYRIGGGTDEVVRSMIAQTFKSEGVPPVVE